MDAPLTAVELTGTIDEQHRLRLDEALPVTGPQRVRVIVLYPSENNGDESSDADWLRMAASNPAFADLAAPEEDLYSLSDGTPFQDSP